MQSRKKRRHLKKKKMLFHQNNPLVHKSIKTTAKLHELGYKLLPPPPYSPDLAPVTILLANLKRMLSGKKFSTNEEAIVEIEAYFEAMSKSYYKNGIENLYDCYNNRCIPYGKIM
jgi:[histone H3]-lysine36 N-dimethyltransferase SETMAR